MIVGEFKCEDKVVGKVVISNDGDHRESPYKDNFTVKIYDGSELIGGARVRDHAKSPKGFWPVLIKALEGIF